MKVVLVVVGAAVLLLIGWMVSKIAKWNKTEWDESIEDV